MTRTLFECPISLISLNHPFSSSFSYLPHVSTRLFCFFINPLFSFAACIMTKESMASSINFWLTFVCVVLLWVWYSGLDPPYSIYPRKWVPTHAMSCPCSSYRFTILSPIMRFYAMMRWCPTSGVCVLCSITSCLCVFLFLYKRLIMQCTSDESQSNRTPIK